jgi:dihydroxyacetone kinase-like protein
VVLTVNSLQVEDIKAILTALAARMAANRGLLIELDSIIGDGDLGLTMSKGFTAMAENAENIAGTDIGTLLTKSGDGNGQSCAFDDGDPDCYRVYERRESNSR